MSEWIDEIQAAETQRGRATRIKLWFRERRRETEATTSEIWEPFQRVDGDAPAVGINPRTTPEPEQSGVA